MTFTIGSIEDYMIQIQDFKYDSDPSFTLPPSLAEAIESFWRDPVIRTLMERSNEFYLMDSAHYFFTNVKRICNRNYVPTQHDVLRAQARTIGIIETRFKVGPLSIQYAGFMWLPRTTPLTQKSLPFSMLDVGALSSDRRKWIHFFEDIKSILFCVAISEYDQVLQEDKNQVLELISSNYSSYLGFLSESLAGGACGLRIRREFPMVLKNIDHFIPQQDGCVPGKIASFTFSKVLPRVHKW